MIQKLPYTIAIFGMFLGVLIAIFFGVNEDLFKNRISEGLQKNIQIQQIENIEARQAKLSAEASKNWRYYQRFHFHSTGIGAMSLALLIFLSFVQAPVRLRLFTSYGLALGGFFYPFVWLFAAIYGPEMGRHDAKEAFAIFGYMGGVFLVAIGVVVFMSLRYELRLRE